MNDKQWEPWIQIVRGGEHRVRAALDEAPAMYSILVALALSCAKWHPSRIDHRGSINWTDCGLCHLFYKPRTPLSAFCVGCPLVKINEACPREDSILSEWYLEREHGETTHRKLRMTVLADKMYEMLMRLYREEYEYHLGKEVCRGNRPQDKRAVR